MAQPQPQQQQQPPPTLFDEMVTMLDSVFPRAEGYIYLRGWSANALDANLILNEFLQISTPGSGNFFTMIGDPQPGVPAEATPGRMRYLHLQSLVPISAGRTQDFKGIVLVNGQCRFYAIYRDREPKRLRADPRAWHNPINGQWQGHAYDYALEALQIRHLLLQFRQLCHQNSRWVPPS
ncbi:hypothetical protein BO86DRAFT_402144 [Aspergillus japonicus CBS 114.51]|uniref:Uncharacterized protein n=2 Tax=Aspergillus TaxID=5052 RepID=A0A2V5GQM9_ASPV1|nr:hypothetical protein BO86DRAFT_402144 [Aspergillus japonicus CBS 114.51]PYI13425.1 hypothetical protein BO99DRAFT_438259 [Aspergillus violaceofuscus CBS 115571]RAH79122.1 hypothetical protein BO86DRAFT_402144 [Aspergillus japonicus CBS 114.51]